MQIRPGSSSTIAGIILLLSLVSTLPGCTPDRSGTSDASPSLNGPYLGQTLPGDEPELFAPEIISTHLFNRDLIVSADGREIWFGFGNGGMLGIAFTRQMNGRWSEPEIAPFSTYPHFTDFEPAISPDGNRIYFLSNRPMEGREEEFTIGTWEYQNIWYSDRSSDGWTQPTILPPPVTSEHDEFYPSLTRDGVLYFTRSSGDGSYAVWRAEPEGEFFSEPVMLDAVWNSEGSPYNCSIDPAERFIIMCMAGEGSIGLVDYWVSFRESDNGWSEPVNLGEKVNLPGVRASSASISPDGSFLFFSTSSMKMTSELKKHSYREVLENSFSPENGNPSIYWMKADFIDDLRPR
jgi:hypothetical protein